MRCFIHDTKNRLVTKDVFDQQSQWEILKFEIQKLSRCCLKVITKEKSKKQHKLGSKLKILEKSLSCDKNIEEEGRKADLDKIYIVEGVKIRSKCQWYAESGKSAKYFQNLKKMQAEKSTIQIVTDEKDLVKHGINNESFSYLKSLLQWISR